MKKLILKLIFCSIIIALLPACTKSTAVIESSGKNIQAIKKDEDQNQQPGIDKDGVVVFDDKYFGYLSDEVQANPQKYDGKKVVITGFVYKSPSFSKDEFKVARMASSRCEAPPFILGLMCRTEKAEDFNHEQWLTVKGTLVVTKYRDPATTFEYERVYLKPDNIERIQTRPDFYLF